MSNLLIRSATGIVFVAVIVGALLYGPVSSAILYAVIGALTVWEFGRNLDRSKTYATTGILSAALSLAIIYTAYTFAAGAALFTPFNLAAYSAVGLVLAVALLVDSLTPGNEQSYHGWANAFAAQLYITLPMVLLITMSYPEDGAAGAAGYSAAVPLSIFVLIWSNDTGAYCVGSLLHKRFPTRLAPHISPNKSWVGTIGGGVLCLLVSLILWHAFGQPHALPVWIGFALVVSVFGTLGDLVESKFKRTLGIKDSGHILPGHGGMLDRFDSLLLTVPAIKVYLTVAALITG